MEENLIRDSIRKEELQLEFFEKVKYFKVPLLCVFVSLVSFTQGFQNFSNFSLSEITTKIGFVFVILGIISFVIKLYRLKLISVEFSVPNVAESVMKLAVERNWETELRNEKVIILKTVPIKGYDDYIVYNRNEGEKIYVFFNGKKILLRSIDNLDNFAFKIQNGENSANEKAVINRIKPAGNSGLKQ
ncbi:hypothetical protein [Flavobacterium sedimenticola]|uniref:Uncharacterized protein n=1 Tax=Flavobacterium sedimenticola TaxID=3043286 RepID=A0ABT6XP56_9FLAO|nr:hypothetical protein [Flavobacterium sedimenticola]MDI9256870.1 hypothetical protein [Flavobacterium sedimenticola]